MHLRSALAQAEAARVQSSVCSARAVHSWGRYCNKGLGSHHLRQRLRLHGFHCSRCH